MTPTVATTNLEPTSVMVTTTILPTTMATTTEPPTTMAMTTVVETTTTISQATINGNEGGQESGATAEGTIAPLTNDNAPVIAVIIVVILLLILGTVAVLIIALICYQKRKHGTLQGCLQRTKTNLLAIGECVLPKLGPVCYTAFSECSG